jgi:ABC-type phosphate transport system auxiliary subunit
MKIKRIEFIPGVGVNITATKTRTLYDETGAPVVIDEQEVPMAVGINDFADDPTNPTKADHELARQKISEKLSELMQQSDADLVAQTAVLTGQLQAERNTRLQREADLEKEKQLAVELAASLKAERAEKSKLAERLEKVNAEKSQLLQSAQRQNDRGNAARS